MTMPNPEQTVARMTEAQIVPRCSDYDSDCFQVNDKLKCYLYDPMKGSCPWLQKDPQAVRSLLEKQQ